MASFTDVLTEFSDMQPLMVNPLTGGAVKEGLIKALCAKIASCASMPIADAARLSAALLASPVEMEHKEPLQRAMEARLLAGPQGSKDMARPQRLEHVLHYLSADDWARIEMPTATATSMMQVIAQRFIKLGIRSLHEQTVRWAIAVVVQTMQAKSSNWPHPQLMYQWVVQFKRDFEILKVPYAFEKVTTSPADPQSLPQAVYDGAYSTDDPPIVKPSDRFMEIGPLIPLRSNSIALASSRISPAL